MSPVENSVRDFFATLPDRSRAVLHWYGPGRAIMSAGSVLVVCIGAWWLLRAPAPPLENSLPMASSVMVTTGSLDMSLSSVGTSSAGVSPLVAGLITVHVVGAVVRPGVYELPAGSRVVDAVDLAGGVEDNADTENVNMALPLGDADQVFIPTRSAKGTSAPRTTVSAVRKPPRTNEVGDVAAPTPSSGSSSSTGLVNVNTADADALEALPGVGPATAKAIIDHRAANGPFASVEDLKKVKGIGDTKFAAIRPFVAV
jgi:competence protein ComEA